MNSEISNIYTIRLERYSWIIQFRIMAKTQFFYRLFIIWDVPNSGPYSERQKYQVMHIIVILKEYSASLALLINFWSYTFFLLS